MAESHANPHDALFKAVFSDPENVVALLRAALPPALVDAIDPGSLKLEPGSFVDEALRWRHADLLFSATIGGQEVLLYFLFEHQSGVDELVPYRMMRYGSRVVDGWLARHEGAKRLPVVVPIVLCQAASGWTGPRKLSELFPLPRALEGTLRRHVVELEPIFIELSARTAAALLALVAPPLARLALLFLKYAFERGGVLSALPLAKDAVCEQLALPSGAEALVVVWSYTRYVGDLTPEALTEEVRRVVGREAAMEILTASQLRELGARSIVERLLTRKFGELSSALRARLEAASQGELDVWADRILTATKLEDVFAS